MAEEPEHVDLIVLGGGLVVTWPRNGLARRTGGSADRKRQARRRLPERGCIPSKTLLNGAKIYEYACMQAYGVTVESAVTIPRRGQAKNKVVRGLVAGSNSS